jgi:hypothetical protein
MAITNKEINLAQLSTELGDKGLIADFTDPKKKVILPADGVEIDLDELELAIKNHKAISVRDEIAAKEAQRQAIAERLGLTADELQVLLG